MRHPERRAVTQPQHPELAVIRRPADAYRCLTATTARATHWTAIRRPLLCAFVLGSTISLAVSGRFSLRLITGSALAWSFVPIFQVLSFAIVRRRARKSGSLGRDVDLFLTGQAPWLLWTLGFGFAAASVAPLEAYSWSATLAGQTKIAATAVPIAAWSGYIDFSFYRVVFGRGRTAAVTDLLLQRAIAWTAALTYFFIYPAWPILAGMLGLR
jgi:hypothetical protein